MRPFGRYTVDGEASAGFFFSRLHAAQRLTPAQNFLMHAVALLTRQLVKEKGSPASSIIMPWNSV